MLIIFVTFVFKILSKFHLMLVFNQNFSCVLKLAKIKWIKIFFSPPLVLQQNGHTANFQ